MSLAFFGVAFFAAAGFDLAASAFFAALAALAFARFSTIVAFPALLSFRFGFSGSGVVGSAWTLDAAHLLRCAAAILAVARVPLLSSRLPSTASPEK